MLDEVKECLRHEFPTIEFITDEIVDDAVDGIVNIHHNYASLENHMGKNYWVHRKGAVSAKNGETGIIPGSMGEKSYITRGLGNKKSLMSCSHGAGRKMSRTDFNIKMEHSSAQIAKALDGIVHSDFKKSSRGRDKGLTDYSEAPGAYKNIEDVMQNQVDLVEPIVHLKPLISLKG